ncbi:MAG: MATE family efflux transporter [Clostridiales bacterium]|nr:MATE family efflux transporter [Clostridiales bacterium]
MNILKKFFSTQNLVKENMRLGEITPSREAYKTALLIALPAVLEMISMSVISMADTAMVGKIGHHVVAAVGLTNQPRMIFLAVFFALNVGVTAIVSRRKGEGDREAARLCLRQALLIELVLVVIMSFLAVILAHDMMLLAGAEADTIGPATDYFRIIGAGLVFNALSMTICGAQRGVGNTRVTMMVNITANVVNVFFNFLLIEGRFGFPRMEAAGAALATVIGYAVGFCLALYSVLNKESYLKISRRDNWKINIPMMKGIAAIGGNSIFEQVAMRIGFFAYTRIVADLGTDKFAAHQIAMQLMNLSFTFADGIAVATTALVGQNLGKKRHDLSIMYGKIGQRMALVIAIIIGAVSISGRYIFPTIFTDNVSVIATTAGIISILGLIQPVQTSQIVMAGSLRGAGDTKFVALTMLVTVALIRPGFCLLFVNVLGMGLPGAWFAIMADQIVRLVMLYWRFSSGKWVNIKV